MSSPSLAVNEIIFISLSDLGGGTFPKESYDQEDCHFPIGREVIWVCRSFGNNTVKSLLLFSLCVPVQLNLCWSRLIPKYLFGVQGYVKICSLVVQVSVNGTTRLFFFFFFNARDQKALHKDVLNHSHLKGNIFSLFKVASLFLWGFLLRACLSLKRFAGSALLANCLGREHTPERVLFYYSLKSVSQTE